MTALLGKALKPIPVNETLLDYLQPQNVCSLLNNGAAPPRNNLPGASPMPLFTGGFIHLTEGMNHERITQKVAGAAARRGGVHHGAGDLCPTVIYCGAEFSFGTVLFRSKSWSLEAFAFIFTDPDFYLALRSGFILAFGSVIIAIPLGGILAFLMVRTDLPGRRIIEPLIRCRSSSRRWCWALAAWWPPGR